MLVKQQGVHSPPPPTAACNENLTAKHLQQGYRYHKLSKVFSKCLIVDTLDRFLNIIADKDHFCNNACRNLNCMVA